MKDITLVKFHLFIWRGRDAMCFDQLTEMEWIRQYRERNPVEIWRFGGHNAEIFVLTDDTSITREEALKTASSFVFGLFVRTEVDLLNLIVTHTHGKPFTNPPY